jgi:hypothetical protein
MPSPLTLMTMAGVSIVGTLMGVHFGRDAIAEINPSFFAPQPSSHFFADLAPAGYQLATTSTAQPEEFWANDINASGRAECFECERFPNEAVAASFSEETDSDDASLSASIPSAPPQQIAAAPAVDRYASFPVTSEEAEQAAANASSASVQNPAKELAASEVAPIGM